MSVPLRAQVATAAPDGTAALHIETELFRDSFDREPFGLRHNLHELNVFGPDSLSELAQRFDAHPADYFVTSSAPSAGTEFFSVPRAADRPSAALAKLDSGSYRILLKRPENHDPRFRALLDELFAQVLQLRGGSRGERLVRLEAGIFITSAASTTPFHFDPEIAFFSQIEGEKIYHVYPPTELGERELERFYLRGEINIGQVALHACRPEHERVFTLGPGRGLHQPQNSPHWVQTMASRSISYSFVFETDASRIRGRARAYNHYLRKVGMSPTLPGRHPSRDAAKAGVMSVVVPLRQRVGMALRSLRTR